MEFESIGKFQFHPFPFPLNEFYCLQLCRCRIQLLRFLYFKLFLEFLLTRRPRENALHARNYVTLIFLSQGPYLWFSSENVIVALERAFDICKEALFLLHCI